MKKIIRIVLTVLLFLIYIVVTGVMEEMKMGMNPLIKNGLFLGLFYLIWNIGKKKDPEEEPPF